MDNAAFRDQDNVVEANANSMEKSQDDVGGLESIGIDDPDSESDFETKDKEMCTSDNSQTKSQEKGKRFIRIQE